MARRGRKKKWKKIFQVLKLGLTNFHLICFVSRRILRWTRLKKVNAVSKEDFSHCDLRYIMNKWGKVDKEFDERERERERERSFWNLARLIFIKFVSSRTRCRYCDKFEKKLNEVPGGDIIFPLIHDTWRDKW